VKALKPQISLRDALADRNLLGCALAGPTWAAWRTVLIASMGEPLTDAERVLYRELSGREREPLERVEELWGVVGRRGGKSSAVAVLICYLAVFFQYRSVLSAGEVPTALCIAPDQRQAKVILGYCEGVLRSAPMLEKLITNVTADTIELSNGDCDRGPL
jgi:hypothetical protein